MGLSNPPPPSNYATVSTTRKQVEFIMISFTNGGVEVILLNYGDLFRFNDISQVL